MNDPFFFGYGSLVNRKTHDYENCQTATISGWKRAWVRVPQRSLSILTAVPSKGGEISGLIASVPNADWAALDEREMQYNRGTVLIAAEPVAIYEIPLENRGVPTDENPILLSYLDVVVQGYLREFGETGVQEFFETTENWHAPILNDRTDPLYPRAQRLTNSETKLVNQYIEKFAMFAG